MLDLKFIRSHPDLVAEALAKRGADLSLEGFLNLDKDRRALLSQSEEKKARRNAASKEVGRRKQAGLDACDLQEQTRSLGEEIQNLDDRLRQMDEELQGILLSLPNLPHASVPVGPDESHNQEMHRLGELPQFDFEPKNHWELGESLDILDFARAAKISGARFAVYKGLGARLERAVINYFMDCHSQNGYTEILPPYLVNSASMTGTGQLPKFEGDSFRVAGSDYYLIPTAEVPVTNLFGGEILASAALPISYTAYSACFRSEAGAAGRDTRGLIRQHQFNKVELVKFTNPEDSYNQLEALTKDAESVLAGLALPYRVICLCSGDLGFGSAKTYDIEVWMAGFGGYREISSCSNYEDFQARRANIRFRREAQGKPEFVHTLNGSGLAVGRTVAAILENYQQKDGSVRVPEALVTYMRCEVIS
ncbi:MAG: serine--tRNA ligase [Clostridiales bacterium]|nr:serine--tRNA ligase [Clostridiales bacterium]